MESQQKERARDEEAGADPLPGPSAHEQTGRRQRESMHVFHILFVCRLPFEMTHATAEGLQTRLTWGQR